MKSLSGSERNRLLLARLFAQPANLLVLDEPTNDLDIETLELLQELVADFSGTLLLVSHDRAFLDNVVTSLLVLEGNGQVQDFVGGYSDWERWRDARDRTTGAKRPRGGKGNAPPAATEADAAAALASAKAGAPAATPPARRKLSYKEQRELAALPAQLEALEERKAQLAAATQDAAFYSRPHAEVAAHLQEVADLETQIETAFARWAELEGA